MTSRSSTSGRGGSTRRRPVRRRPALSARRRRQLRRRRALAWAVVAVLATGLGVAGVAIGQAVRHAAVCAEAEGFGRQQLDNARSIVAAGRDAGLPARDQTIAVMTALGESSLQNIDYGDWETSGVTNPDGSRTTSIGLFQQQDGWGTREQRLDPYTAASLFYRAMVEKVPEPERSATAPTEVAHRVQINRDPTHYAPYWPLAERIVAVLDDPTVVDTCL
ncbi:peptidase M23 [uncultured Microbacterium sp.]|uniref:peptidase M23 n=1 Tax=uncultured Microbacterium sp. TaxID=191216 RepID=UPI0025FEEC8E|nr:peptidase M23 [uncultured Microbacterium sp.]